MILVTGANGFVGHKIMEMCEGVIACPSLRNKSEDEIRRIVEDSGADTVIHTAAISDIGACAADPDASYHANVMIPVFLAKAAKNIKLICFSSDQVYTASDREGPYTEDMAKPGNIYAEHKLEMENRVLDIDPDAVMLRAEWMYDHDDTRSNYFMNILNAKGSVSFSSGNYRGVTYVREVAENMDKVIKLPGGAYNFGSETQKSIYEITKDFIKKTGKDIEVKDCPPLHNLWINCEKARKHGVLFSSVEDGLVKCLKDYGILTIGEK
ncbi:MAG: sugar nucleotide-binding protein [Lachnospiraceae bacterium]|nr:sugar nucleotide-binding protein [Lachnospiraceae bacterium]